NRFTARKLPTGQWAAFGNGYNSFMQATITSLSRQSLSAWIGYYPIGITDIIVPINLGTDLQLALYTEQGTSSYDDTVDTAFGVINDGSNVPTTTLVNRGKFNTFGALMGSGGCRIRINGT